MPDASLPVRTSAAKASLCDGDEAICTAQPDCGVDAVCIGSMAAEKRSSAAAGTGTGAEGTGERGCLNVVELGEQQGQRDLGDRLPVDPGGIRPADPARAHDSGIDEPVNPGEHELHEADVGGQRVRQLATGVDEELGVVQIGGELVAGGLHLPDDRIPDAGVHGELQLAERS